MMLHTKCQDSRPCGFRHEDFFHFFPILYKTCEPREGPFWPQGHILNNKLGRGLLDDAIY